MVAEKKKEGKEAEGGKMKKRDVETVYDIQ